MTSERYNELRSLCLRAKRAMDRNGGIATRPDPDRPLQAVLPTVTFAEDQWLRKHHPSMLPYTQLHQYPGRWKPSPNAPIRARHPIVREIWLGARSLSSIGQDELPEGLSASQAEQEDIAELTDLQTLLYQNPMFEALKALLVFRLARTWYRNIVRRHRSYFTWRRKLKLWRMAVSHAQYHFAHAVIIEDEQTGALRFLQPGDVIQMAWGSNEDLDTLYMEEPASERSEDDSRRREILRDQIRANTYTEAKLLEDPTETVNRDNCRTSDGEPLFPESMGLPEWLSRKEYFDALETLSRRLNDHSKPRRLAAPSPVDWDEVRPKKPSRRVMTTR